ncbi:UDP-glucoronosyl and UDP-glucosyl transferase family protein [Aureobasidium pullulans]|uniref:UDP-glucoronosyl and UDP-glucosyl transferase family protein n=1 Tax=Aureobasidium pullulans TaxID=5580 RepID=A0A4S9Z0X2_AURPU|nr:UDP-glucoronosyl and UDP-glucosyl transferase family protein [Aureobasidium pullulans]THZ98537.1 UDP-glucoronosyl and UDP-glucosyl transferase family protein [Aureobasidium pullulans]
MEKQRTLLFVTNSELGQAGVILAVAYEFLVRREYDVHIASFPALQSSIDHLNDTAFRLSNGTCSAITFHHLSGKSMKEAAPPGTEFLDLHPPGIKGALFAYDNVLPATFAPWHGVEYMIGYSSTIEIINHVAPRLVVVDPLFSQAVDASNAIGQKCMILSPNTFKELVLDRQPSGGALWKFPAMASGFPYPVPWSYIPANIYLIYRFLRSRRQNERLLQLSRYRQGCGLPAKIPSMFEGFGDAHILLPSTSTIDYDFSIPSHVTPCGPIIPPFEPLAETDPKLSAWLQQGPTVLINLGSHVVVDQHLTAEFAAAVKTLLDRRPDVQILWKLKTKVNVDDALHVIAEEIKTKRVWIESWLPAHPLAILMTNTVVCTVHHGGSNSYHEAIYAGVPQVVLPVWIDTYDFAIRVEYLGIGVWGNRVAAPYVGASELGTAFLKVVDGRESAGMMIKAKSIAVPFQEHPGRQVAFEKMTEILEL